MDRIENNTFGVCEKCGEDISLARLKARPVTTQCIDCKTKEEAVERPLGYDQYIATFDLQKLKP